MTSHKFNVFADYFQFYLQDESVSGDLSAAWTEEATKRQLAVADGTIGVGTARNTTVPITVEVLEKEPPIDFSKWDRVMGFSIRVPSGALVIAGCTDYFPRAGRIRVAPGDYQGRVLYGGLSSVSEDGLSGHDHYKVVLWKGEPSKVETLKAPKG